MSLTVVGAGSPRPDFSEAVMERLFYWVRDCVASIVANTHMHDVSTLDEIGNLEVLGAFVSFKKNGRLRSCMGYMDDGVRLGTALEQASISAATRDPRFPPISTSEFYDLDLEVWTLGAMKEVEERGEDRKNAVQIGRNGIQIQGRGRRGLLLPSVALEMGWNVERFLDGVCDKTGLSRGAWKDSDVRLFTFEGISFKKPFVWNVSKNPELATLIKEWQNAVLNEEKQTNSRPSFSISPSLFQWQVPFNSREKRADTDSAQVVRTPAVAGMFYPKTAADQQTLLDKFDFEIKARPNYSGKKQKVSAALIPHAGWIYSGKLTAETLSKIEPPELIVVLAPKHRREGANFAVAPCAYWDYNGGKIANDLEFVDRLVDSIPSLKKDVAAHRSEHSIEVQLPFIARYFPNAKVVGILIGYSSKEEIERLSIELSNFLTSWENSGRKTPLLIVSSDMNHYANDTATRIADKKALDALETTDPNVLFEVVMENRISMCGILPAFLSLLTLKQRGEFNKAVKIGYSTSGDATGDLERVVGYAGYLFV